MRGGYPRRAGIADDHAIADGGEITRAAAIEQQAAATQEISSSVQTVTMATNVSAQAMEEVSAIAAKSSWPSCPRTVNLR